MDRGVVKFGADTADRIRDNPALIRADDFVCGLGRFFHDIGWRFLWEHLEENQLTVRAVKREREPQHPWCLIVTCPAHTTVLGNPCEHLITAHEVKLVMEKRHDAALTEVMRVVDKLIRKQAMAHRFQGPGRRFASTMDEQISEELGSDHLFSY